MLMPYAIDMVSDFTFFENVLLGLADALHKCVGVKHTHLKKTFPLTHSEIAHWESSNGVMLSEDFQAFFLSCNGYHFKWNYTFAGDDEKETTVGVIHINSLDDIVQVYGYETTNNPGVKFNRERYIIRLAPESKIFEIAVIHDHAKVVLVYLYPAYIPTIWLLCDNMNFYYLAKDLVTYLRMSIAHLGIPKWQLRYTLEGLPQWTENMFRLLIPNLLNENRNLDMMLHSNRDRGDDRYCNDPLNKLDPAVFNESTYIYAPLPSQMEIAALEPEKLQLQQPEKLEKSVNEKLKPVKKKTQKQKKKNDKLSKPASRNSANR